MKETLGDAEFAAILHAVEKEEAPIAATAAVPA